MRVIPTFCAMTPERMCESSRRVYRKARRLTGSELYLHVHARGEVELHQRVHGLGSGVDDIENALVRAHLELLARLLVDVRRAKHRKALDAGRQRDRPADLRAGPLGRRHDFARRSVEDPVIERLEANADILTVHGLPRSKRRWRGRPTGRASNTNVPINP